MVNWRILLVAILAIGGAGVVKRDRRPEGGAVAIQAIAGVVIGRRKMTGDTFSRRSRVSSLGMTGGALDRVMTANQRVEAMIKIVTQEGDSLSAYAGRFMIIRPDDVDQLPGAVGNQKFPDFSQQCIKFGHAFAALQKAGQDAFTPFEEQVELFQ